jgi:suppressor for copper-sensitivity B
MLPTPRILRLLLLGFAALAAGLVTPRSALGAASEWSANPHAKVRLLTSWEIAPRQGPLRLGLHFQLTPGWHVYWKNAGDAGYPPALTLEPKGILGEPRILWPAPGRFELPGGLVAFAYEGEVVYPVLAPSAAFAAGDSVHIAADLDYLVCAATCIPYRTKLELEQPLGDEGIPDPAAEVLIDAWWQRLPRAIGEVPGVQANAAVDARKAGEPALEVRILGPTATPALSQLFLESQDRFDVGRPSVRSVPGGVVFRVGLKPRVAGTPLPATLSFAWTATGLRKGGETFSLEARGDVPVTTGGDGEVTGSPEADGSGRPGTVSRGLPAIALRAFLAGLFQLATPAPFALLLALLLALRAPSASDDAPAGAETTAKDPSPRERFAAAATGVVAGSWIVAGLASWALRSGFPLSESIAANDPSAAALLAALALLLALNLWGLVPFPVPGTTGDADPLRLLAAGLLAAPLALAWPFATLREPFEAGRAHGPAALAALLAAVGLGLAAPFLVGVLAPGFLRWLPASSRTDGAARTLLGFVAAAGVLRLLFLLSRQIRPEGLAALELALLGAALCAWLALRARRKSPLRTLLACAFVAALAAAPWIAESFRFVPRAPRETVRNVDALPSPYPGGPIQ